MTEALLTVQNLSKKFVVQHNLFGRPKQYLHAVDNVSLSVQTSQTLGLVGESGCGKSTLGRTILRLYEPDNGSIIFKGQDITRLSGDRMRLLRRELQMIFQDPFSSLNPKKSIAAILSEPFQIHGLYSKQERQDKIKNLLETVGLGSEILDRYPHEFSGGQRQRIGIARAIALNPRLIIADEPVSALDVSIQSGILNLLAHLRRTLKLSYIFIAHDLAVVEFISDFVAVMYLGQIVEHAAVTDLFKKPRHPYTQALISAIPVADPDREKKRIILPGDVPSPINRPQGCYFHPRCPIAKDHCRKEAPKLRNVNNKKNPHWVACHYADS